MNRGPEQEPARRLARNFSWLSLQELVIRLIGLATAIYLARVLSPSNYGALGLALAVYTFGAVFVRSGTGSRATRLTARDPAAVPGIFAEVTGLRLAMAALMIGLVGVSSPWLGQALQVSPVLLVLCSLLLLRPALTVVWAFRGLDRMHVNAVGDMTEKVLMFAGLLLLVRGEGNDVFWAPVVELVAALLIVAFLYRQLARLYGPMRPRFDLRAWREISREALPLSLAAMLSSIYLNGGVLLLGWLADTESAALFLVAQKITLTLATLLILGNAAAFPSISRLVQDDSEGALRLSAQILRYFLVLIIPLFLLVAFHASFILGLLFGAAYRDAAPVLVVLLVALPFLAIASSSRMLLMAIPMPMSVLGSRLGGAVVLLGLSFWLIPDKGAVGAALAVAAGEMVNSALMLIAVHRATGGLPWNVRCLAPVLAGAASAASYVAFDAWPVVAKLSIAAMIYTALVLLLRGTTIPELRNAPSLFLPRARGDESERRNGKQPGE